MAEPSVHCVNRLAATAALACYDLPPESRLRAIRTTNNAVFEVATHDRRDTEHRYVLRVHRPRYRSTAPRSELYLLQLLQDRPPGVEFSVPEPVPARDGRCW